MRHYSCMGICDIVHLLHFRCYYSHPFYVALYSKSLSSSHIKTHFNFWLKTFEFLFINIFKWFLFSVKSIESSLGPHQSSKTISAERRTSCKAFDGKKYWGNIDFLNYFNLSLALVFIIPFSPLNFPKYGSLILHKLYVK